MPLDAAAIGRACGGRLETGEQLCGRELERVRAAMISGRPVTVSCTLKAPLFREVAEEVGAEERVAFANIRETAGWSAEAGAAGPKMAALLAAAAEPMPPAASVSFESRGVVLVYGRDEVAIEAGRRLADHLDVTVLLSRPGEVAPPRSGEIPVLKGTVRAATGHLGAFRLTVDDTALPLPSSRRVLAFGPARNGATSTCDIVVDLTGGTPLFPAHDLRSGYLRADPRDPAAVERVLFEASHLVGTFDKTRFVDFHADLCAHSRSRITGCTRCLDVCPTGAIAPAGDHVAIDPHVCAGCGSCASVCPTGAAAYALPPADALMRRLRTLLAAYRKAGGQKAGSMAPVLLIHDDGHGAPLIDALARFGEGLPADVLPFPVNEVTQVGPETIAAAFAYGAGAVRLLVRARPKHDVAALARNAARLESVVQALGYGPEAGGAVVSLIETDDPEALGQALAESARGTPAPTPSGFMPDGDVRGVLRFAVSELHHAAPRPVDLVALDAGAPFGGLDFRTEACTLCHACVGACPTGALADDPDRPRLTFAESACVQCGLCAATCPEDVIGLKPQLDFAAWAAPRRVLKEEEPFDCVSCGKAFGTRSTIERVIARLRDRHWMFAGQAGEERIKALMMCDTCRVSHVLNEGFDPHAAEENRPRTSEDYIRAREA
ncbi:4Fe-4S binding protein [Methylobacterium nonmethylotrophicum]|uniref:4Fe-4S dicluster domain-containing protein n=1 Tax=Methylobacterium nonmethylotrophicum TaxID=1141884 RepID=A0A4Z0NJ66_9HYPH|nr:4Fe-4S binding protein [Methylobacterium nonmethylotrophicum]TGD96345.1 4Fe-4S dicluster domain-containing protein [Methylobacterium nonmethylotrophicum]